MSGKSTEETTPAQKHIAARMLARAETLLLDPSAPYRDQLVEMFSEETDTPQSEFRQMLSCYSGVRDDWVMSRVEKDLAIALEMENRGIPGFNTIPPRLNSDSAYQLRYEEFREFLYNLAVNDAQSAHITPLVIH